MYRTVSSLFVMVSFAAAFLAGCTKEAQQKTETAKHASDDQDRKVTGQSGEVLFKQYCSSCHPDGGNVSDSRRPLYGSALRRNHITTPEDIVRIMRKPLSRMIRFDVATLSDKDAAAIAEYILTTFK